MTMISEEILGAYADGELEGAERLAVERALLGDPSLRAALAAQKRLRERLGGAYDPVAAEDIPDRFRHLLEAEKPTNVVDFAAARERRSRFFAWPQLGAMAAALGVGVLAGQLAFSGGASPFDVRDGALVAEGQLAEALETRLASNQAADAEARVGLTFRNAEGRICRTFDLPASAGIACRAGADWSVVMTAGAPRAATEFRQAGSGAALVMEQAQAMMAGDPLDAEAEARAKESGWR